MEKEPGKKGDAACLGAATRSGVLLRCWERNRAGDSVRDGCGRGLWDGAKRGDWKLLFAQVMQNQTKTQKDKKRTLTAEGSQRERAQRGTLEEEKNPGRGCFQGVGIRREAGALALRLLDFG